MNKTKEENEHTHTRGLVDIVLGCKMKAKIGRGKPLESESKKKEGGKKKLHSRKVEQKEGQGEKISTNKN